MKGLTEEESNVVIFKDTPMNKQWRAFDETISLIWLLIVLIFKNNQITLSSCLSFMHSNFLG